MPKPRPDATQEKNEGMDHAEKARQLLHSAIKEPNKGLAHWWLGLAQTHAQIATVEELQGIRKVLESVVDVERGPAQIGTGRTFIRTGLADA
jgi:hypothetical protein